MSNIKLAIFGVNHAKMKYWVFIFLLTWGARLRERNTRDDVSISYNCTSIKDHIHRHTGIDSELILVDFLFIKDNNKAFKIVVPNGKMQQVIASMGNEIKAEPFKERSNYNNRRDNSYNTFRGPPPTPRRPPAKRQPHHQRPYQRPNNFGRDPRFIRPKRQFHGSPYSGYY